MANYRSFSNGKSYELTRGARIGAGAYGSVGQVEGRAEFVYKDIPLTPKPGDWVAMTRELRIKATYRELWALKKLNLLEGYIRENDTITIIMRKLDGTPEITLAPNPNFNPMDIKSFQKIIVTPFESPDRPVATFKALLALNAKGICQIDPNPENSLIFQDSAKNLHANIIDFSNATEYTLVNIIAQFTGFDMGRPHDRAFDTLYTKALQDATSEHILKKYSENKLYYGFAVVAGVGLVSTCGFSSWLLWQLVRSCLTEKICAELRAMLDIRGIILARQNETTMKKEELVYNKALLALGYMLINVYNFANLYYSLPSLKLTESLYDVVSVMQKCDNGTLSQFTSNLISECILPLANGALAVLKDPSHYWQKVDAATADKLMAEMAYLAIQLKTTTASLLNTLERLLPADCLLVAADVLYKYNPTLLFTGIKTQIQESMSSKSNPEIALTSERVLKPTG